MTRARELQRGGGTIHTARHCDCYSLHDQWLRQIAPEAFRPGVIIDTEGKIAGRHTGLPGFTVGQRKGLGVGGPGGPKFVLHIDTAGNRVIIGSDKLLWINWCEVEDVSLICGGEAESGAALSSSSRRCSPHPDSRSWRERGGGEDKPVTLDCDIMVRYNGTRTPGKVTIDGRDARVSFAKPARAPTPGQSAVFYQGDRCLGGGVISATELTDRFAQ